MTDLPVQTSQLEGRDWSGRGRPVQAQISGLNLEKLVVVSDIEICQANKLSYFS